MFFPRSPGEAAIPEGGTGLVPEGFSTQVRQPQLKPARKGQIPASSATQRYGQETRPSGEMVNLLATPSPSQVSRTTALDATFSMVPAFPSATFSDNPNHTPTPIVLSDPSAMGTSTDSLDLHSPRNPIRPSSTVPVPPSLLGWDESPNHQDMDSNHYSWSLKCKYAGLYPTGLCSACCGSITGTLTN